MKQHSTDPVPRAAWAGNPEALSLAYSPEERKDASGLLVLSDRELTTAVLPLELDLFRNVEVLLATWGMPVLTPSVLAAMPNLRAIFYAAGTTKGFMTEAAWDRGVVVSSAWQANGVSVAEYTLAMIILALKNAWPLALSSKLQRKGPQPTQPTPGCVGAYGSRVGLVSLGAVGRHVRKLMRVLEVEVLAYDPYCSAENAAHLGVKLVELDELFSSCQVVSLHTPLLPSTRGMIGRDLIERLPKYAALINTARGGLIREDELVDALRRRPDLTAYLDVTEPEPPVNGSDLYELPNVFWTPHIAGSQGPECRRMGRYMVNELRHFLGGEPLQFQVTRAMVESMA